MKVVAEEKEFYCGKILRRKKINNNYTDYIVSAIKLIGLEQKIPMMKYMHAEQNK